MNMRAVGADTVARVFGVASATVEARAERKVRQWGYMLETTIKGNASGRPGPRTITGDYRRSWTTTMGRLRGAVAAIVGTNSPQGRRLEYGFVGEDSLGRHYDQPPYPHVRPAMKEIEGRFVADMSTLAVVK